MNSVKQAESTNVISSAANTLRAFRFIADSSEPVNVTDIADHIGVSHPTAFRIARTLASQGYIDFDPSTRYYKVSMELISLVWNVIDRVEIRDLARPTIRQTVQQFGETITLAVPGDGCIIFVDRVEGTANVRFYCDIGRRLPLHAGAAAKAILAHLPEPVFEDYVSRPLERLTPVTTVDADALRAERDQIRQTGYSISIDEVDTGVSAVGVPILNQKGEVIAAAAIANLTVKWDEDAFNKRAATMLDMARQLNKVCAHLLPKAMAR